MKTEQQEVSICLNDIPREKMRVNDKGKIYVSITIAKRKEKDQWGRDLKVYITQTREDREKNLPKVYVGGGKTIIFESTEQDPPTEEALNDLYKDLKQKPNEDLPY